MKTLHLILGMAGLLGASTAQAQTTNQQRISKTEPEGCVTTGGNTECRIYRFGNDSTLIKRAAIGVQVQTTGTKRDTLGVFIARVTPDGPAEKAGIIEGERIASINGVDLRVSVADMDDSYTAGIASHRLTREVQKLTPGSRVTLRVYSGGRFRDVQVTTARASELAKMRGELGMSFPRMPGMPIMPNMPHMQIFRDMEIQQPIMPHTPRAIAPARVSARISRSI